MNCSVADLPVSVDNPPASEIGKRRRGAVVVKTDLDECKEDRPDRPDLRQPVSAGSPLTGRLESDESGQDDAGGKAADVSGVVDCGNRETDHQVDDDDGEDPGPDRTPEEGRYSATVPDAESQENSEQAEDCAGRARRQRMGMVQETAGGSRYPIKT